MLKRLLILLVTAQLLFNGVGVTAHTTESDHDSHNMPHLHVDSDDHPASHHSAVEHSTHDKESEDHDCHKHFHIYFNVFLKSDELNHFEKGIGDNLPTFRPQLASMSHTPPVPPPNR